MFEASYDDKICKLKYWTSMGVNSVLSIPNFKLQKLLFTLWLKKIPNSRKWLMLNQAYKTWCRTNYSFFTIGDLK